MRGARAHLRACSGRSTASWVWPGSLPQLPWGAWAWKCAQQKHPLLECCSAVCWCCALSLLSLCTASSRQVHSVLEAMMGLCVAAAAGPRSSCRVERWWLLSRRRRDAAQAVLALSNCLTRCYGHDGSSRSRVLLITVLGLRHTSGAVRILLLCSSLAPAVVCSAPAAASQQHTVSRQHQSTTGRLRFQGRCTRPAWRHHCAACLCIPLPHAHHHHRCLCFALPPHRPHAMSRVARAVTAVLPPRPPVGTAASAAACRMSYSTQHANHEHGQARCRSLDQAVAAQDRKSVV